MSPILYLANFAWNNAKYPSSKSLLEITNSISNNLQFYDTKLKQKVTSYGEARNSLANYSKRA